MAQQETMKSLTVLEGCKRLKIAGIFGPRQYHGIVRLKGRKFSVIFGYEEGKFEHVSISAFNPKILPTWEQMCELKDIFFYPEEMVVQIHPRESEYIHGVGVDGDNLKNVLHLWRAIGDKWEALKEE